MTILRFGVVIGVEGGALATMLTPFKLGVGGTIGDGKMMTSWIDIKDLVCIYRFVIDNQLEGVYNAVSPSPVSKLHVHQSIRRGIVSSDFFACANFCFKVTLRRSIISIDRLQNNLSQTSS